MGRIGKGGGGGGSIGSRPGSVLSQTSASVGIGGGSTQPGAPSLEDLSNGVQFYQQGTMEFQEDYDEEVDLDGGEGEGQGGQELSGPGGGRTASTVSKRNSAFVKVQALSRFRTPGAQGLDAVAVISNDTLTAAFETSSSAVVKVGSAASFGRCEVVPGWVVTRQERSKIPQGTGQPIPLPVRCLWGTIKGNVMVLP